MSESSTMKVNKEYKRKDGSQIVACYEEKYEELLTEKVDKLRELLKWKDEVDIFRSPTKHFRMRANFNLWHDNPSNRSPAGAYYAMYDEVNKKEPCEIIEFPRGTLLINKLMTELKDIFNESKPLFNDLFEVRFVTTLTEQAVITLCYRKPIPVTWQEAAELAAKKMNAKIVGRSRKVVQIAGGDDTVMETLTVNGTAINYFQTEGAFSQPNAKVCEKMIEWTLDLTKDSSSFEKNDLLELYCGGGTFTAALARNFNRVLATEISKTSVELASKNFKNNNITNIKVARLSSEEFSLAYNSVKTFQRLQDNNIDIKSFKIGTVLVDPPRAGLDDGTCTLLSQFDNIIYISCNPVTLARDVEKLQKTHNIIRVAAFDQFPYTHHLESGVYMVKNNNNINDNNNINNSSSSNNSNDSNNNNNNNNDSELVEDNNSNKRQRLEE